MKKLSLFLFLTTVGLQLNAVRPSYTSKQPTEKHALNKPTPSIEKKPRNSGSIKVVTKELAAMNLGTKSSNATNLPPKPNFSIKKFLKNCSPAERRMHDF